jgi:hypothetical protein
MRHRTQTVAIVDRDYDALMRLTVLFGRMGYGVSASESHDTMATALELARGAPEAMIVALNGTENVAELGELLSANATTRYLFLLPAMPPTAAMARLLRRHGATALAHSESTLVVVSTLVALMASAEQS